MLNAATVIISSKMTNITRRSIFKAAKKLACSIVQSLIRNEEPNWDFNSELIPGRIVTSVTVNLTPLTPLFDSRSVIASLNELTRGWNRTRTCPSRKYRLR